MRDRARHFRPCHGDSVSRRQGRMPRLRRFARDVHAGDRDTAQAARCRAENGYRERRNGPMTPNLQERITDALSRIRSKRVGTNVLEAEMVSDIATTTDGKVR